MMQVGGGLSVVVVVEGGVVARKVRIHANSMR
jgi:hypothetical protein